MTIDYLITGFLALAILVLLGGIKYNENCKKRRFHLTPGGKTILIAYGMFILVFAIMVFKLLVKI